MEGVKKGACASAFGDPPCFPSQTPAPPPRPPCSSPRMPPGPLPTFTLSSSTYPDASPNLSQKCGCLLDTLPKPLRATPGRPPPGACPGPAHLIPRLRHARPARCATPTLRKGLCSPSPARAPHLVRATPLARSLKAPRSRVLRDTYSSGDFVINCLTFPEYEDYAYSWFVILSERRAEPRRKRSD